MKKYNELFGFNKKENYTHVNFIRVVKSGVVNVFDFIKNKNERLDQKLSEKDGIKPKVYYIPCEAKYGDTIFLVFIYVATGRTEITSVFKDPVDAVKEALKDWNIGHDGIIYEVVRVKIEPHMCIGTPTEYGTKEHKINDFFDAKDPQSKKVLVAWRSTKENNPNGSIDVDPEYGQIPEIKNLLLSLNTINKFNL